MRHIVMLSLCGILASGTAGAGEITVFTSGVTFGGISRLATEWSKQTGNKVNLKGGTIGGVKEAAMSGPGDVIVLPPADMKDLAAKLEAGTTVPVGRALFGLAVKAGAPHPDISTVKKFAAVLRASSGVGFPDPATKSLSGLMVSKMLMRPEFKGVTPKPLLDNVGAAVAKGEAELVVGTLSEEINDPGAEVVGTIPASLDLHIDFTAAVLAGAAAPAEAAAFVQYIARTGAATAWNTCGIQAGGAKPQPRTGPCLIPAPTIMPSPTAEEARAPRPPRARGIATALAIEGAEVAIATCLDNGYKVTALIVDSGGVPIAMISGDGAAAITQRIAMGKAQTVIKYHMTSGEAAAKAAADSAFMAQLAADSQVGTPRQGAIPIVVGGETVGAFAVSGAPGGDKDEPCAKAGLAKIQDRLK